MNTAYQHKDDRTRAIAEELAIRPDAGFIETKISDGHEYVRGTCGKPDEFSYLRRQALDAGFTAGPKAYFGGGRYYFPRYYKRPIKKADGSQAKENTGSATSRCSSEKI